MGCQNVRETVIPGVAGRARCDLPGLSLVKRGEDRVWTGFATLPGLLHFKEERGLGPEWHIRDRRSAGAALDPVADRLLVCAGMIRDHIRPLLAVLQADRPGRASFAADVALFAAMLIHEQNLVIGGVLPGVHAVRGQRDWQEWAWLVSGEGALLDLAEIGRAGALAYHRAGPEIARRYDASRHLSFDYDNRLGALLRGDATRADMPLSRPEMRRRYEDLSLAMSLCLERMQERAAPRRQEISA
ncbi:hypothetical protein ACFSUD_08150 [Sulfitobacter aestuarii]|uniref:Uncharacterized protein n=1 Tax=Sulfitobacter aestuarii TaxID=2161676 RepID=A0ABW5U1R3_9RHOB